MTELRQNEKLDFIYLEIYRCYCYGTKLLVTFSLNGTALRKKSEVIINSSILSPPKIP